MGGGTLGLPGIHLPRRLGGDRKTKKKERKRRKEAGEKVALELLSTSPMAKGKNLERGVLGEAKIKQG